MVGEGEIHRLKEKPKDFDPELFNFYYKSMTPLITNLVRNIDPSRFNVTKDILVSYFYDKLYYVFCKYYDELHISNPEKFKATILRGLMTFKSRLLKNAYSGQSLFNDQLARFDDCFESSKKDIPDIDDEELRKREKISDLHEYMRNNLSQDAYLLFQVTITPPPFFLRYMKSTDQLISTARILEFFELPKTKTYISYISELREEIKVAIEKLKS